MADVPSPKPPAAPPAAAKAPTLADLLARIEVLERLVHLLRQGRLS